MATHEERPGGVSVGGRPRLAAVRRGAFYLAVLGALALYAALMGGMLTFVVRGWFVEPGVHHFHDLVLFGLVWVGIVGLAVQLYRPHRRVNAAVASVLVMLPLAAIAVGTGSPIAMMPVVFSGVGLVVVALHPAGRSVFEFELPVGGRRALGGLLAVAAVPLLGYAGDQLLAQFTVADDHAALVHYGGMATASVFVLLMGTLATLRGRDRRFAAWSAGLLAGYVGVASVVYPGQPSSIGATWGALAVLWGLTFVGVAEATRADAGGPIPPLRRRVTGRMEGE